MALGLRAAGARVVVTGRDPGKNAQVAAELGPDSTVLTLDVRCEEGVAAATNSIVERLGHLDILVNNAGVVLSNGPVTDMARADWDTVIDTNLTGAFLCAKHAARAMIRGGHGGKIINVASIYASYGPPDFAHYPSAKAGLLGLTRALAVELAPHDVQVNAILPGWFPTAMTGDLPHTALGEQIRRKTPAGRWGDPSDLVGAAVFLASRASNFVTGTQLAVDGGYLVADRLRDAFIDGE
jgi:2-deoxy-D-gluconate 3-dehydrogenase